MKKEKNIFYIVKKGDSLETIAKIYETTSVKILILNNLTPNMIKDGTILYIK